MSPRLDSIRAFDLPLEGSPVIRVPEGSRMLGLTVTRPAYLGGQSERLVAVAQVPRVSDSEVSWRFRLVALGDTYSDWEDPWHPQGVITVGGTVYAVYLRGLE